MITLPFDQALIIQPYWLNQIYHYEKRWEMRSTKTNKRGTFGYIEQGSGLITGQFDLIDSLEGIPLNEYDDYFAMHRIPADKVDLHKKYPFPWVMENVIKFDVPVEYKHPQGAVIWVNI
jgi:uncharacterized protein YcnI